jgi:hypothetical protein
MSMTVAVLASPLHMCDAWFEAACGPRLQMQQPSQLTPPPPSWHAHF